MFCNNIEKDNWSFQRKLFKHRLKCFPSPLTCKKMLETFTFYPKISFFFHSQNPFQLFTIIKPLHVWFLETANFRFGVLNNLFLLVLPMKSWALRFRDNIEKVDSSFQRTTPLNTDENVISSPFLSKFSLKTFTFLTKHSFFIIWSCPSQSIWPTYYVKCYVW
jgi:hypothetical protein